MRKNAVTELLEEGDNWYDSNSLESMGCHMFFGEVDVESSLAACDFILKSSMIRATKQPLTMFVNSVGGDCQAGFAVIDLMETSRIPIATVGIGTVMSMGVLLVSGGTKGMRTITKNCEIMAHQFSSGVGEMKYHDLIATNQAYHQLEHRFMRHFLKHSTMTEKQIRDVLFAPSDRYLTPADFKRYGLCDRVVEYFDQPLPTPARKRVRR
jgi:ATP-dependent Clp protease protease subunit